ncbi:MAG: bifunctional methylenetetrahydrofolate dehydrogenase/methenyltetrahydrofolate cyclohydrolase FolD [Planctomycetota bacterium]|jgi:methylenetetrahydrofolate dehydrogenase (NADP+)/methenyltetrahydrofolate cyclohydrolase|nr:bifunctional methylenetetrahydrofolate dehydrogenase/methenyltetrahydrofolate cyclohydrolase FolD [Planctomycetota bacterium]
MARILDGKALASQVRQNLKERVAEGIQVGLPQPGLATVLVGDDPASHVYVKFKRRACDEVGFQNFHIELPADTTQGELLSKIDELNTNPEVHGILVQLPLPKGLDEAAVLQAVSPLKDADGFHPMNQGALMQGKQSLRPCTPLGIMSLIEASGVDLNGKKAVVVGRSNIVGKPIALMLLEKHATVSICHSRTADLAAEVRAADVLIAAVGRAHLVQGQWIKEGAVVIDVGINRLEDGSLTGDVDFEKASERASWITPVPGGVGPMTIAMLLSNTLDAAWGNK